VTPLTAWQLRIWHDGVLAKRIADYGWYRVMCWSFRRMMLLSDGEQGERS
jgi:hypothetical protein